MDDRHSRPGNSDHLLLALLGKGLTGYFEAPKDRDFSDLLARLDAAGERDRREARPER